MKIRAALTFCGWPILFFPALVLWVGIGCNMAATYFNGGVMPVRNPMCFVHPDFADDGFHTCITSKSHLKLLVDTFPSSGSIVSVGDILQNESDEAIKPSLILWCAAALSCLFGRRKFYLE